MTKAKRKLTAALSAVILALAAVLCLMPQISVSVAETVGAFTVDGGQKGKDYKYENNVLTVLTNTSLTISNADPSSPTTDGIEVYGGIDANITLNNVNINASADSDSKAAFKIADNSTGNVTVTLLGNNKLQSGFECAGLQKNGSGNNIGTLTIMGTGSLEAKSSNYGAGIGGGYGGSASNIRITGGSVKANTIGGGDRGKGPVTPTLADGTTPVYLLEIDNPDDKTVLIDNKSYTPVNHKAADSSDGKLYAYLPAGTASSPITVTVGTQTTRYYYDTAAGQWVGVCIHENVGDWLSDSTGHWHICNDCSEKVDFEPHTEDSGTITTKPTETAEGVKTFRCTKCGYVIRTETIPVTEPEHTHSYGTEWKSDSTSHWHECSCGDKTDIAQHIEDMGTVTVRPAAYQTGLRTYSCTVCGYVIRTETIPAAGVPSYPDHPEYSAYPYPIYSLITEKTFTEKLEAEAEMHGRTAVISWNEIKNADGYIIYQLKDGKYVKVKTTTDTSVMFSDLTNGRTYKFMVKYTKDGRISPTAYADKITVRSYYKPTVRAAADENSVTLRWEAVPNAEKYAVYKYADGKAVKLAETKKLAAVITGLKPDTEYKYIVSAYVDGEWTAMTRSDIVTVRTKAL